MPVANLFFSGTAPDIGPGARHPQYRDLAESRQYVRDADTGERAILASAQELYVPKPGGLTSEEYTAYLRRPAYYNVVERTADSAVGLAFRSDPEVNAPGVDLDNVDLIGNDVFHFARRFCRELILMGQATVAVDVANNGTPYLRLFRAEDTFNWMRSPDRELVLAILHEVGYVDGMSVNDLYRLNEQHQLVEYALGVSDDGVETQAIARKWALVGGQWVADGEPVPLTQLGSNLDRLPVRMAVGASDGHPPMEGLARLAAAHYRLSCDLHHALFWVATPTPYATGMDNTEQEIKVGSTEFLLFSQGVQPGLLEFTGHGVEQIRLQIEHVETQMAAVGARLLSPPNQSAETAETTRLKGLADTSLIVTAVNEVSAVMTWALRTYAELAGRASESITFEMSTDFTEPTPDESPANGDENPRRGDGAEVETDEGGARGARRSDARAVPRGR